jgi:conjugal transfer/entry exclusion protein
MTMTTATASWPTPETDPQRKAILAAADRLLAGTPRNSSGNLSVVQLAIEAQVKYWVVAQRHTDLRDHFQALISASERPRGRARQATAPQDDLREERDRLRRHCSGLEQLVRAYAAVINELSIENQALRDQLSNSSPSVTPLQRRRGTNPR